MLHAAFISNETWLFTGLLIFRIINSFLTFTIFEPDEYYQCTEMVQFLITGKGEPTWDWHFGIRSITYPLIYALPSAFIHKLLTLLRISKLDLTTTSFIVIRLINSHLAALCDFCTIKIYEMIYGDSKNIVFLTLFSHGLWLYSIRSHVNTIEMVICIVILYIAKKHGRCANLKIAMILAILVVYIVYLRITAILILCLPCALFFFGFLGKNKKIDNGGLEGESSEKFCAKGFIFAHEKFKNEEKFKNPDSNFEMPENMEKDMNFIKKLKVFNKSLHKENNYSFKFNKTRKRKRNSDILNRQKNIKHLKYAREYHQKLGTKEYLKYFLVFIIFSALTMSILILIDSIFYHQFTIPPFNFVNVNIFYGASNLFGRQPILSHFFFIIILIGLPIINITLRDATIYHVIVILYICLYSCVGHKEMRFLMPIVPLMNILVARQINNTQRGFIVVQFIIAVIANLLHQNFFTMICLKRIVKPDDKIFLGVCPYSLPQYSIIPNESKMLSGNPEIFNFLTKSMLMNRFAHDNLKANEYFDFMKSPELGIRKYLDYDYLVLGEQLYFEVKNLLSEYMVVKKIRYCLFKFENDKDPVNYILKKII